MLVTDRAGAMRAANVKPSRLAVAQRAARNFLDRLPREVRVGVVAFSDTPTARPAPTTTTPDGSSTARSLTAPPTSAMTRRSASTASGATAKTASAHR